MQKGLILSLFVFSFLIGSVFAIEESMANVDGSNEIDGQVIEAHTNNQDSSSSNSGGYGFAIDKPMMNYNLEYSKCYNSLWGEIRLMVMDKNIMGVIRYFSDPQYAVCSPSMWKVTREIFIR